MVLLGDAAHASSPMMGQGGCLAMEDALVLAEELRAAGSLEAALDRYVSRHKPRVQWVQQQSRAAADGLLNGPPAVRNAALRARGEQMLHERYAPLVPAPWAARSSPSARHSAITSRGQLAPGHRRRPAHSPGRMADHWMPREEYG